jgi:hypothetical protein
MSRSGKAAVASSLLVTAAGMAVFGWALSGMNLEQAGQWSTIVQAFAALLAAPGLVFAALALRGPADPEPGVWQSIQVGSVNAGRDAHVDFRQNTHGHDAGPAPDSSAKGAGAS